MKIEPTGHYVVVKPDPVEEKSKGGILIVTDEDRERQAQIYGTVVAIGPRAFEDFLDREVYTQPDGSVVVLTKPGKPWVEAGERVAFSRYAGKPIGEKDDGLFIMNDADIVARISDD